MDVSVDTACLSCGTAIPDTALFCRRCGARQPGAAPPPGTGTGAGPDREPVLPGQLPPLLPTTPARGALLAAGLLTLGLLLVTMPPLAVRAAFFAPQDTVERYFDALADRDAAAALAQLTDEAAARAAGPLTSGAALTGTNYLPPSKVSIVLADKDGDEATADVTYRAGDRAVTTRLKLQRGHALLDRWRLDNGTTTLPVDAADGGLLRVGNVDVVAGAAFSVLHGGYLVKLADTPLLTSTAVTVVPGDKPVYLSPQVRSDAVAEIDRKVKEYVDTCAKSAELKPPGCPFGVSTYYVAAPAHWQITRYPKVGVALDGKGAVTVRTTTTGTYRVTGGPGSYSPAGVTGSFSVDGVATSTGQTVEYASFANVDDD